MVLEIKGLKRLNGSKLTKSQEQFGWLHFFAGIVNSQYKPTFCSRTPTPSFTEVNFPIVPFKPPFASSCHFKRFFAQRNLYGRAELSEA